MNDERKALRDAVDEQVDFDVGRQEVMSAVFEGKCFTVDDLLDIWNEEDLTS